MKTISAIVLASLLLCSAVMPGSLQAAQSKGRQTQPQLEESRRRGRTSALIADEVRHQLVTLPYYGVFDWLEAEVLPNDAVVLRGEVTQPRLKSDAEATVKRLESVSEVRNEIEVLPLSAHDDEIRLAMYRAIFNYDSPTFQYSLRAVSPIHIIVKNGHVMLKGMVANDMHRQLAYMAARSVLGVFDVKNELQIEPIS